MTDDIQESVIEEPVAEEATPNEPAVVLQAKLVVKRAGALTDVEFPVNPPTIIGRFDPAVGPIDVDLAALPEGQYVSRKHAKITLEDGVYRVHDLGSSNGTYVLHDDFTRVEEAEIEDGMEIALGNARFVFKLEPVA